MKRGIIMDELNMDSLDLPEMEHDYSDVPDASEGLDGPARTSPAFGAGEDLSDIEMPVLSEMDGSAPVQPVKAEPQKQAPVQASVQTSAQISEMGGVSPMGGISEMGASSNNTSATGSPAANSMTGTASVSGISEMGASSYSAPKRNVQPAAPVSGGYTPVSGGTASTGTQNNGAASYSSVYNRNDQGSAQRTNDFFAATEQMNAEKYERGHGKANVLGIISIVLGAFTILGHLEVSLVGLLGIVLGGLIIYHALKFMKQSEKSRRTLAWLYVWDLIDCIRGIIMLANANQLLDDMGIEASSLIGVTRFIYILGIIFNGVMTYFFMFNSAVHDYTIDDSR